MFVLDGRVRLGGSKSFQIAIALWNSVSAVLIFTFFALVSVNVKNASALPAAWQSESLPASNADAATFAAIEVVLPSYAASAPMVTLCTMPAAGVSLVLPPAVT